MTLMALIRHQEDAPQFNREVAAQLAGLSPAKVRYYERLGLVSPKVMPGGGRGYSWRDVRRLARIRRLQEDLGLDLPAIEVVLACHPHSTQPRRNRWMFWLRWRRDGLSIPAPSATGRQSPPSQAG
jgi:DNA-binding transcriptional MerR regulator